MRLSYLVFLTTSCIKLSDIQILEIQGERQQCNLNFRLMFTYRVFLSPGRCQFRLCSLNIFSSLLPLLSFLMFANTIVDDNPTYSEPDFSLKKLALAIVGEESRKSA